MFIAVLLQSKEWNRTLLMNGSDYIYDYIMHIIITIFLEFYIWYSVVRFKMILSKTICVMKKEKEMNWAVSLNFFVIWV